MQIQNKVTCKVVCNQAFRVQKRLNSWERPIKVKFMLELASVVMSKLAHLTQARKILLTLYGSEFLAQQQVRCDIFNIHISVNCKVNHIKCFRKNCIHIIF